MESNGFDDQIFHDFQGQSLTSLQTAGATMMSKGLHQDRGSSSMHPIQVMLGMQHHQDMMLGVSPMSGSPPPHAKMADQQQCHPSLSQGQHDLMFHNPALDSPGSGNGNGGSASGKRKTDDGLMLQPVVVTSASEGMPITTQTTKKSESKKKNDNNGIKKKKTRYLSCFFFWECSLYNGVFFVVVFYNES